MPIETRPKMLLPVVACVHDSDSSHSTLMRIAPSTREMNPVQLR